MKAKYDKEVKKGKPGKGKGGKTEDNQTDWVFFDRTTLEDILKQADPETGGIKFYLTEYTRETAEEFYPGEAEKYEGRITLVMEPSSLDDPQAKSSEDDGGNYYNRGRNCPPWCEK